MNEQSPSGNAFEPRKPDTPGRDRAEASIETLRQVGGVFVEAVRATRMAMVLTDPSLPGNPIVFANESFLKLSGYAMDEVLGQQPHFMDGPETDPKDAERFRRILEADEDGVVETVQYAKDGRRFVANVLLSAFRGEDGRTLHHFLSWADVTRQVDAEQEAADLRTAHAALRESEERYRTLFESIDQGYLLGDVLFDENDKAIDIHFVEANSAALRLAGRDFTGRRMREIDPHYEESWYEAYGQVALTGVPIRAEQFAEPDGRWFDFRLSRIGPPGSRRVASVFQDITERKEAGQALRESEEKYRTLFEEMDEGFALCELVRDEAGRPVDFCYLDLNPALTAHVGIAPETLRGRLATEAFPDRDPWYLETYAQVVESGQSVLEEHYFEHVDRWLRMNVYPRGGDLFAVLYSDVTERNRAETVLRESEHRQAFLLRFTDAIRSEPNEQAIVERAVRMLSEELSVDRAYATRHFPTQDLTHVVFQVRGPGLEPLPATLRFSDFPEAGRQTFERTLIFEDTANDQTLTEADKVSLSAMGVGALLSRPLRRNGSPVFALGVVSTGPRRWTPTEVALLEEATERTWEATERARTDAAVRESRERLSLAFQVGEFASWDWDLRTGEVTWNDRHFLVQGYDVGEVTPSFDAWLARVHPDDRQGTVAKIEAARDAKVAYAHEFRMLWPDGTVRWCSARGEFFFEGTGEPYRMIGVMEDVTDERLANEALRESEERLRKVIAAETVGVVFFDLKGCISDFNDAFLRSIGFTREELDAGQVRYEELTPPEWRWRDEKTIADLQTTGRAGPYEKEYFRRDGSRMWILCSSQLLDPDTAVEFVVDVTEAKRAEAKLRDSEERFRRFGEASQDILWMRDAEMLQWTYLTPAFEPIYGLSREEALKGDNFRSWLDLVVAEDRELAGRGIEKVRSGEQVVIEYRIKRQSDGRVGWLRETSFPIYNAAGEVALIGGIGHDVTELRESEEQRRTSEERLGLIVENARDYAIFTTDPEGRIDRWYKGAAAVFGWSTEEATGQLAEITFTPEDRAEGVPAKEREKAKRVGRAPNVRWHIRNDGQRIFIDGVATALWNADGVLTGYLKIGQDVTERHAADERQKLLLAELQHRVRNIMAMVRSVVRQSSEGSDSVEDFVAHLVGRLDAMARTQGLLTRAPGAQVNLEDLVRDELHAQVADETRLTIRGEEVSLSPKAAEVLTLAIHELATNSIKYGALSDPRGRLAIAWEETRENSQAWLTFTWQEWSPAREAAPVEAGFGTELIEERVPYELRGRASLQIHQDGVRAEIAFPLTDGSSILETGPGRGGMSRPKASLKAARSCWWKTSSSRRAR